MSGCPFCDYAGPSTILRDTGDVIIFEPLNPVTDGHVLAVPTAHAEDWTEAPLLAARTMKRAAEYAAETGGDWNLITSKGAAATQTVRHLHLHLIPRSEGDGLQLPWSSDLEHLQARVEEVERERDLAIAHDRQPYPTADAYEKVCAARTKWQERAEKAEQTIAAVRGALEKRVEKAEGLLGSKAESDVERRVTAGERNACRAALDLLHRAGGDDG